jgi:hypothetical protein
VRRRVGYIPVRPRLVFGDPELEFKQTILKLQAWSLLGLALTWIFVAFVEWWAPGFFRHPNLTWSVPEGTLVRFWPLFAYAAVMALVSTDGIRSTRDDERIFGLGLLVSTLAGIWEEIGYRYLFVCTAMVGIVVSNWLFGTAFGTIFAVIALGVGLLGIFSGKLGGFLAGLVGVSWGCFWLWLLWSVGAPDPIYWFYGHVMVPFVNAITLGQFEPVFKNPALPPLFVFGMIAANANFRDGHKYQGPVGWVNAWIIGFIMMYAAVTYGIGTAIAAHAIYDIEFSVIRYLARKFVGRRDRMWRISRAA